MELRIGDSIEFRDVRTGRWQPGTIIRLSSALWSDGHMPGRVRLTEADTDDYEKGRLRATLDGGRVLQLGGKRPIDPVRPYAGPLLAAAK